jgi:MATE family multidrug resistance protein
VSDAAARAGSLAANARRIVPLAWPVFVGQIAVLAFGTADTVLLARYASLDLAALAVGGEAYISVFVGLMGVVMAIAPIAGQLYGAGRHAQAGAQLRQAAWLAVALSAAGCALLVHPQPFLSLAHAQPAVAGKVRAYTGALAFALPPALLFAAFRGFNTAVSRPKAVMAIQLAGLALKLPLSALLIYGAALPTPAGELRIPSLGIAGCGIATALVMWAQWLVGWTLLRRDPFYAPFGWHRQRGSGFPWPRADALAALLRLGVPMGLSILVEVTGFTFMAFFIARLGTVPAAGHQIAANLAGLLFMMSLAIANATSTLVAQRVGAGDRRDARRLGWHGLALACGMAAAMGGALIALRGRVVGGYTHDPQVAAAALPLVAWVGVFHVFDAAQTVAAFVLRARRIATAPLVVYALCVWVVGLGGGYALAFGAAGVVPAAWRGAPGFWLAATLGLLLAALALNALLALRMRIDRRDERDRRGGTTGRAAALGDATG